MRHNSLRSSNCANGWQASLPFLRSVRVEAKPRAGERHGAARLASFGLAAVLTVLPAFALWGALATYQAGAAAKHASDLSEAFGEARYAIGSEESLERKYRLEQSPEVRARHHAAAISLTSALQVASALGGPVDVALIDDALAKHKQYLQSIDHMFAAIDAGDTARANEIDGAEVDPTFDAIETRVDTSAETHRARAVGYLNRLARIQTAVLMSTPAVFALGMGLVVIFWGVLRAYRRQVDEAMKREGAAVRRNEQRFRSLIQHASDVVLICTSAGNITYQSPAAKSTWGYSDEGLLNQSLVVELVHPDDQPALRDLLQQSEASPGTTRSIELRLHDAAGAWRFVEFILTNLLHEPSVEGLVATARDITQRKAFEEQLMSQAFHDSLTGLPNRALLRDRLTQALARASRHQGNVAVLFIDLDNFKLVNDSLGHQVGDGLLAEAAKRLQESVRDENTVARLGGDEFVVLLDIVAGIADAALMAERIARQFDRPFTFESRDFTVTASIGIALGGAGHEEQVDSLLRNADIAMYRAKAGGKARYVAFDSSMQGHALARLELENDLRRAIQLGELCVYYQPIVVLELGPYRRGRGTRPLGAPDPRSRFPYRLRSGRRGNGPHRPAREVGIGGSVPPDGEVAGTISDRAAADD